MINFSKFYADYKNNSMIPVITKFFLLNSPRR